MNIINNAYAQSSSADGGMSMLIMVGIFFIIMYFILESKLRKLNVKGSQDERME